MKALIIEVEGDHSLRSRLILQILGSRFASMTESRAIECSMDKLSEYNFCVVAGSDAKRVAAIIQAIKHHFQKRAIVALLDFSALAAGTTDRLLALGADAVIDQANSLSKSAIFLKRLLESFETDRLPAPHLASQSAASRPLAAPHQFFIPNTELKASPWRSADHA